MKSKESDDVVKISYTEATLRARGQFAELRAIISRLPDRRTFFEEVDRLMDVLTDAYYARDGMVPGETHSSILEGSADEISKLEEELGKAVEAIEKLEEQLGQYEEILKGSDDDRQQQLAILVKRQASHENELRKVRASAEEATRRIDRELAALRKKKR
jgi:chromosome segregation ATPase